MDERDYYLGFSVFPGIGPVKFSQLIKKFGSAKDAWGAPEKDLEEINHNPIEIAKLELEKGVLPITLKRPMPKKVE